MAVTKPLIINLSTSAVGIFLCLVALVTPGWISWDKSLIGVFYVCTYPFGRCSAFLFNHSNVICGGIIHLHLIDVQLAGVIAIVLGVVGWLVLLVYAISKESSASVFVRSGIILLVASTFEFFLLVKFILLNVFIFQRVVHIGFPFSMLISSFGLVLIMFTVVRIFIRNKQMLNSCNSNERAITSEPDTSLD
ncbi:uncharacterized protein LOC134264076 [Saccostrea cucullata]|uniref:uncharacterized protein LOC134264076 n=1 Tax=Saccostrea cuccullata TaxID=36930 RepID=UPI002ED0E450